MSKVCIVKGPPIFQEPSHEKKRNESYSSRNLEDFILPNDI